MDEEKLIKRFRNVKKVECYYVGLLNIVDCDIEHYITTVDGTEELMNDHFVDIDNVGYYEPTKRTFYDLEYFKRSFSFVLEPKVPTECKLYTTRTWLSDPERVLDCKKQGTSWEMLNNLRNIGIEDHEEILEYYDGPDPYSNDEDEDDEEWEEE